MKQDCYNQKFPNGIIIQSNCMHALPFQSIPSEYTNVVSINSNDAHAYKHKYSPNNGSKNQPNIVFLHC